MKIVEGNKYLKDIAELINLYLLELDRNLDFQDIDQELKHMEDKYTTPNGRIYVALVDDKVVGCVAYHQHTQKRCEMKRLYVLKEYRCLNVGQKLIDTILACAQSDGYQEMVLDTIQPLQSAIHLYQKNGFYEIEPYYDNPMDDVIYMKKDL